MTIHLTATEACLAYSLGAMRSIDSLYGQRKPAFREDFAGQMIAGHIMGACAEMAVAKYLGVYFDASYKRFQKADIESRNIEVRWSTNLKLKIRVNDADDLKVVSVSGVPPDMTLNGWMVAWDAKRMFPVEDLGGRGTPAHFVPVVRLVEMGFLS